MSNTMDKLTLKRFGYTKENHPSTEDELHNIVKEFLQPFDKPVGEKIDGIDYLIIAGFFDLLSKYLIYHCPSTYTYAAHMTHRDDYAIKYNVFPLCGYHSTFEAAIDAVAQSFK